MSEAPEVLRQVVEALNATYAFSKYQEHPSVAETVSEALAALRPYVKEE